MGYRAVITNEKIRKFAFLVALTPALPMPENLETVDEITNLAVIAANDDDGNGIYGYVALNSDEKEIIGSELAEKCAEINKWYWCELYE